MFIYFAMTFTVFAVLSMIFNPFFYDITIFGTTLPFNVSVIFFCMCFFILDLTTELYNKKAADYLIYGKILCQIIFVVFGSLGIIGANLQNTQLDKIVSDSPHMVFSSIFASLVGYKLTTNIMDYLKIRYNGNYLTIRYLLSTLPGELVFSLVFALLSFSRGRTLGETIMVFIALGLVKIVISVCIAFVITPLTKLLKRYKTYNERVVEFVPFT